MRVGLTLIVAGALAFATAASGEIIQLRKRTFVSVKAEGAVVRAYATARRSASADTAAGYALRGVAIKARQLGFPAFAVTKTDHCGSLTMGGDPLYHECRLTAQLLQKDEPSPDLSGGQIRRFEVDEVLAKELREED